MSATGTLEESPETWLDAMQRTVARPVRSASLFYSLYHLVEVEGVDELRFDFERIRDQQHHDWYRYGVYSVANEFAKAGEYYYIGGTQLREIRTQDDWRQQINGHLDEIGIEDVKTRDLFYDRRLWGFDSIAPNQIWELLDRWQQLNIIEDPDHVVRMILTAFRAMSGTAARKPEIRDADLTGWTINFNGDAWESICEFLLQRDEYTKTAWVDTAWSIEHNNSSWIDKIQASNEERRATTAAATTDNYLNTTVVRETLKEVLDAKRAGNMEYVVAWATHFDNHDDLGIGIAPLWREITGSSPPNPTIPSVGP